MHTKAQSTKEKKVNLQVIPYFTLSIYMKKYLSFPLMHTYLQYIGFNTYFYHVSIVPDRVSSVELSVVFSVEKMSVEKNMTLNSTINNTKFFLKNNVLPQSLLLLMRLAWIFAKRSKKVCPSWPKGQKNAISS